MVKKLHAIDYSSGLGNLGEKIPQQLGQLVEDVQDERFVRSQHRLVYSLPRNESILPASTNGFPNIISTDFISIEKQIVTTTMTNNKRIEAGLLSIK